MIRLAFILFVSIIPLTLIGQIDISIAAPGTYGTNPTGASMEIAIMPASTYSFPPAAAEFNLILFAPIADLNDSETFSVLEDNVNNGAMSWDAAQNFNHNGNRYFVFTYSGTGINLSAFSSGSFQLALTIGVTGGMGTTTFCIADENSDVFTDFGERTAIELASNNELNALANSSCLAGVSLPIELLHFQATTLEDRHASINWAASNSINFSHFELERSIDVRNWEHISTVQEKEILNGEIAAYDYLDKNVFELSKSNIVYYRLKMIDEDGTFAYSAIAPVSISAQKDISIYPNPTTDNLTIQHDFTEDTTVKIVILDIQGKEVKRLNISDIGASNFSVDVSDLAKGTYLLQLTQGTQTWVEHIVIE